MSSNERLDELYNELYETQEELANAGCQKIRLYCECKLKAIIEKIKAEKNKPGAHWSY